MRGTIAALSTAPAPSGVAVIRLSGTESLQIANALFSSRLQLAINPRQMLFGTFHDGDGGLLDSCLAVFMPGPKSFTGEDIVEFHLHGSPVLVKEALRLIYNAGALPAEAGEFTRRAFLNDKLDLVQAEAVGDIIHATNKEALKIAQGQLDGRLSSIVTDVGEPLRDILAELEAGIDFPEEDINPDTAASILETITDIRKRIAVLVDSYDYGHVVRDGFRVLLFGKPNVGKSSLLNYMLGTNRAIVTEISGTTRDTLEEQAMLDGLQFVFCDTAGITETEDLVEQIGIERARERIKWADLVLFMLDAANPATDWQETFAELASETDTWVVVNKIDVAADFKTPAKEAKLISVKTESGCKELKADLVSLVQSRAGDLGDANEIVTNERHRDCLRVCHDGLERTMAAIEDSLPLELISAELRSALTGLNELIGKTETEDILGRIFSKFCIGK